MSSGGSTVWRQCGERDPVAGSGTARGRYQAQAPGRRPPFAPDRGACRTDPFGRGRQERHYAGGTAGAAEGARRRRRHRHSLAVLQTSQDYVCSDDTSAFGVVLPTGETPTALKLFDLKTGEPKGSVPLPG